MEFVTDAEETFRRIECGLTYDVILCDLMMPRVHGTEFYFKVRNAFPLLAGRIIFITGGGYSEDSQEFLGMVEHPPLEKPFDKSELEAGIREVLRRTRSLVQANSP